MSGRCIAMWSGPRNISTAMMRSWENRSDTHVVDEPFYAHYLCHTGVEHPMREAIMANGELDWYVIARELSSIPQEGIFYQKHITTHWLPHFSMEWLENIDHVFLIREPKHVVASYAKIRHDLNATDLGYEQQAILFESISTMQGKPPIVIDSTAFLSSPEKYLKKLCVSLSIEFDPAMLSWPKGARESDGIWAPHWYKAVIESTGFSPPKAQDASLNEQQAAVADECQRYYDTMAKHALTF